MRPGWRWGAVILLALVIAVPAWLAFAPAPREAADCLPGKRYFSGAVKSESRTSALELMREPSLMPAQSLSGMTARYRLLTSPSFDTTDAVRIDVAADGRTTVSVTTLAIDQKTGFHVWSGCRWSAALARRTRAAIDSRIDALRLTPGINDRYRYGLEGTAYLLERRTGTAHEILDFSDPIAPDEQAVLDAVGDAARMGRVFCSARATIREIGRLVRRRLGLGLD